MAFESGEETDRNSTAKPGRGGNEGSSQRLVQEMGSTSEEPAGGDRKRHGRAHRPVPGLGREGTRDPCRRSVPSSVAVVHYRATGKRSLLDIAVHFADLTDLRHRALRVAAPEDGDRTPVSCSGMLAPKIPRKRTAPSNRLLLAGANRGRTPATACRASDHRLFCGTIGRSTE